MVDWQLLYLNALLILLDLMRRQEELRRLEELRNQELQKRKQIQLRYFVFHCAEVWPLWACINLDMLAKLTSQKHNV